MLKGWFSPRLLKKVQMPGGARCETRGVLTTYVAASREYANAADGPFSAACYGSAAKPALFSRGIPSAYISSPTTRAL